MTKLTSLILTLVLLTFVGSGVSAQEAERVVPTGVSDTGYIDVHLHLRGGVLRGDTRINTQEGFLSSAANLIMVMDSHGFEKAIVMPPPQIPDQDTPDPGDYELLLGLLEQYPGRIYVLAGGRELNVLIHQYREDEVTDEIKEQFRKKAEDLIGLGITGFGETTALHLSFSQSHPYAEVQPDHPLFLLLADIAAEHGLPLDIHTEALPENINLPEALGRASPNNPPTLQGNIPGLEHLLAHNRQAKIVWQHIGWDNTGHMTVELLRRLLQAHPNLYMALKIRMNDFAGQPMRNRIVDGDWKVKQEWLELFEDFPDRFMIGTDEFIRVTSDSQGPAAYRPDEAGARVQLSGWSILQQLPVEVRQKIGRDNAARIYNLE